MRAPSETRRPTDEITADICRLQPGRQHRADMMDIIRREIHDLRADYMRFTPLLRTRQAAKRAKDLISRTRRLRRDFRELAQDPLPASPLLDRPSFFSFAEAEPRLDVRQRILATVPKITDQRALDRPPGVELRLAADQLERSERALKWLARCRGPHGHAAFGKYVSVIGAQCLIAQGLDHNKEEEIARLVFEAVTGKPDHGEAAFARALKRVQKVRNAKK